MLVSALIYFGLIVGGGVLVALDGLQGGHLLRATIIGGLTLLAFVIWLRIVSVNWRALNHVEEPQTFQPDETVWGVGGPAMREPGSTGIARTLRPPKADQDQD